jgi:hypothetical protein
MNATQLFESQQAQSGKVIVSGKNAKRLSKTNKIN